MHKSIRCLIAVTMSLAGSLIFGAAAHAQDAKFDSDTISGLGARNIGSAAMSGRVAAIAAVTESGRLTVYVGAASGGVWKSINGGTTFKPVFDKEAVQSIGAITIDPQSPKTIWVGTGEAWTRNSTSIGDGIYKSTDAGKTWAHLGLRDGQQIPYIIVDPRNADRLRPLQDHRRRQDLDQNPEGAKSFDRLLPDFDEFGGSQSAFCGHVGFPPKGLDVPLRWGKRDIPKWQWVLQDHGWRSNVARTG